MVNVHGGDSEPRELFGALFLVSRTCACQTNNLMGRQNLGNEDAKQVPFHRVTAAEFARLSSSRQLTLLAICRAQLSSRLAATWVAESVTPRTDDSDDPSAH